MKTLSIVIPAYNEEDNIEDVIEEVLYEFRKPEIIVVNDASTDNTLKILKKLQKRVKSLIVLNNKKNMGHGYSVVKGLKAAKGQSILYIDADCQIAISNFLQIPSENLYLFDAISGYRVNRQDKPFRKFISFCLKATNYIRHGYYIKDANCPFKIYRRESVQPLLRKLPKSYIVPIACLEVLIRKEDLMTGILPTIHAPYAGQRKGFLQSINIKSLIFFWDAFKEVVTL